MSNPKPGREKVFACAYQLLIAGKYPTEALVEKGTGCSPRTVNRWMKDFRDDHREQLSKLKEFNEPMPQEILEIATNTYNMVLSIAERRFNDARVNELEIQNEGLRTQLEQVKSECDQWKGRVEMLKQLLDEVKKEKPDMMGIFKLIEEKV
jgi:hypothetical protein